ncbi:GLPGLI family protein [Hymenobacter sp. DG01]|uniref:GLPGLI family protein n=1 Tax=Hymenobacter sp. DG01 TaxID=2584940 RepID=UPI00111F0A05|nr:GLPGLI family protein [Hymenobacter sp. DG01]
MKHCIIVILLLAFHAKHNLIAQTDPSNSTSRSITCIYKLTYQPDSLNNDRKTELMSLTINPNLSKFESQYSYKADSIMESVNFSQASVDLLGTYLKTGFSYELYKLSSPKTIRYYDKIGRKRYEIAQQRTDMRWQTTTTTKKIAGYSCRKAITTFAGRHWEAWFTTEVPVSEGPYKFSGLPGLIIEIYDTKNNYHFALISLKNKVNSPALTPPTNLLKTNETTFKKAKQDYLLQGVTTVIKNNSSNSPADVQKQLQAYKDKAARRNNPIELK